MNLGFCHVKLNTYFIGQEKNPRMHLSVIPTDCIFVVCAGVGTPPLCRSLPHNSKPRYPLQYRHGPLTGRRKSALKTTLPFKRKNSSQYKRKLITDDSWDPVGRYNSIILLLTTDVSKRRVLGVTQDVMVEALKSLQIQTKVLTRRSNWTCCWQAAY